MRIKHMLSLSLGLILSCVGLLLGEADRNIAPTQRLTATEASSIYGGNGCTPWILVLKCDSEECGQQSGFSCAIDGNIGQPIAGCWCCDESKIFPIQIDPDICYPD